jgi:micrococcal nuclease
MLNKNNINNISVPILLCLLVGIIGLREYLWQKKIKEYHYYKNNIEIKAFEKLNKNIENVQWETPEPTVKYYYTGFVNNVVDGDTVDIMVDLGLDTYKAIRVRFAHMNAPEMHSEKGKQSKQFLIDLLEQYDYNVLIKTEKDKKGKYGRHIVTLFTLDGKININKFMIDNNHAVLY